MKYGRKIMNIFLFHMKYQRKIKKNRLIQIFPFPYEIWTENKK